MKTKRKPIPLWLDDLAKKYWKQMSNDVNLDDRYLSETFAQYCMYLSEYRRAVEQMEADGMVITTEKTIKPHPCLNIKNQAQVHIQRLSKILFTPKKSAGHIESDQLSDFFNEH